MEEIFYFQAADRVTQILNSAIPAQIVVRTVARDLAKTCELPRELQHRPPAIPAHWPRKGPASYRKSERITELSEPIIFVRTSTSPSNQSSRANSPISVSAIL